MWDECNAVVNIDEHGDIKRRYRYIDNYHRHSVFEIQVGIAIVRMPGRGNVDVDKYVIIQRVTCGGRDQNLSTETNC